jgi:hypothetical protein
MPESYSPVLATPIGGVELRVPEKPSASRNHSNWQCMKGKVAKLVTCIFRQLCEGFEIFLANSRRGLDLDARQSNVTPLQHNIQTVATMVCQALQ